VIGVMVTSPSVEEVCAGVADVVGEGCGVVFAGVAVWFCVVCVEQAAMTAAIIKVQMSLAPKTRLACSGFIFGALPGFSFSDNDMCLTLRRAGKRGYHGSALHALVLADDLLRGNLLSLISAKRESAPVIKKL
jgi:hypothetical protein